MKKLKKFIDNLASDKKSHVVLGQFINPNIIIIAMLIGAYFNSILIGVNLGVLVCLLIHATIEFYQKITGTGKKEFWDFAAGSWSAINLGIALNILIQIL